MKKKNTPPKTKFDVGRTLTSGTYHPPNTQPRASSSTRPIPEPPNDKLPPHQGRDKKRTFVLALFSLFAAVVIVLVIIIGWDVRNASGASQKMFGSGNVFGFLNSRSLTTDSNTGRVNVLIAGYSADDPGHAGATLTDSIILLSLSPASHTGYMLSVPRDLYVAIPGYGYGKINEAYNDGGMSLLQQIVEKDFGVKIGYWTLVDYSAVRGIVDAVGGIDVNINSPDGRLYDPNKDWTTGGPLVDLYNGVHHLNGQQALDLSRARGDPSQYGDSIGFEQSDFQRTADQQLVFKAIKKKLSWTLMFDPVKNGRVLNAIADNVKTSMTMRDVRPLFGLFNRIPDSKMQSLSLRNLNGKNYLSSYSSYYSGSALVPAAGIDDYSQIDAALAGIGQ